ncbi:MAG TPA: Crp/Fnr family transcriptional regulator [Stellaceae bacterium]|nr:Crp/Fnr family transcriptional regulator [Stellaceae bacterium]
MIRELTAGSGTAITIRPVCHPEFEGRIEHGRRIIDAAFGKSAAQRKPAGTRLFGPETGSDLAYRLSCGWAYRAVDWPDGRRAIIDLYLPGDVIGIEAAAFGHPVDKIVAVTALTVQAIDMPTFADLMTNPPAAAAVFWLLAEQQRRIDRLAAALARRDAHERLALMLSDLYDRLCPRGPIACSSYALPLTQQQIGDHLGLTLVHVNRVLRSLREKKIVSVDRHVVTIRDLERLRQLAASEKAAPPRISSERPSAPREPALDRAELGELALS